MLVNEVHLEIISVFERLGTERAVLTWLVLASEFMVVGPMGLSSDIEAVVAAEEDLVVSEHKWAMR
jgi:hypothetical protein